MLFVLVLLIFFSSFFSHTSLAQNTPCSFQVCVPTLAASSCQVPLGTLVEFEIWRQEYYDGQMGNLNRNTWHSDFARNDGQSGCDGLVDLVDFEVWRQLYLANL